MLFILDITRRGDSRPTRWYFDDSFQMERAAATAAKLGAAVQPAEPDSITDADECSAWLSREV